MYLNINHFSIKSFVTKNQVWLRKIGGSETTIYQVEIESICKHLDVQAELEIFLRRKTMYLTSL